MQNQMYPEESYQWKTTISLCRNDNQEHKWWLNAQTKKFLGLCVRSDEPKDIWRMQWYDRSRDSQVEEVA